MAILDKIRGSGALFHSSRNTRETMGRMPRRVAAIHGRVKPLKERRLSRGPFFKRDPLAQLGEAESISKGVDVTFTLGIGKAGE